MSNHSEVLENVTLAEDSCCSGSSCCAPSVETVKRDQPKIGRNDPCVCGNGKKYKKCCGQHA